MSRDYGRVHAAFWTDDKRRTFDDGETLLALYVLTCPHSNAAGAFLLPDAYVADDLGWPIKTVRKRFQQLSAKGFLTRFLDGRHVIIRNFLKYNPPENENVVTAIVKQAGKLPPDPAISFLEKGLALAAAKNPKAFPNGIETVLERLGEQFRIPTPYPLPTPEPEPEPEPELSPRRGSIASTKPNGEFLNQAVEAFCEAYPLKVERLATEKIFRKLVRAGTVTAETLIAGAQRYAAEVSGQDPKFIKHPPKWLNAGCWADEPKPSQTTDRPRSGGASAAFGVDAALREFEQ